MHKQGMMLRRWTYAFGFGLEPINLCDCDPILMDGYAIVVTFKSSTDWMTMP